MIANRRIHQRFYLPILIITLFCFGCAANPLTPGSVSLKNNKVPIGFAHSGKPLLIKDLTGTPFILYVKSKWCPLCKNLDSALGEVFDNSKRKGSVSLITLELVERRILDQSGAAEVTYVPGEETGVIPGLFGGKEVKNRFLGDSGRVKKILRLKKIPVLIGFNKKGQVAGTLHGYQTEMDRKIEELLGLVLAGEIEITEKSAF